MYVFNPPLSPRLHPSSIVNGLGEEKSCTKPLLSIAYFAFRAWGLPVKRSVAACEITGRYALFVSCYLMRPPLAIKYQPPSIDPAGTYDVLHSAFISRRSQGTQHAQAQAPFECAWRRTKHS